MPTAATSKKARSASKPKAAPVEELDEDDLEEVEEDSVLDADAPTKTRKAPQSFGVAQLAVILSDKTGKRVTPRDLRVQLRKMAKDQRINREIVPGNKTRYEWSGPNDPEVKAIIQAVTSGEIEETKKEALAKLKESKAAKAPAATATATKKKKAPAPVVEDDDEEEFEDDDE